MQQQLLIFLFVLIVTFSMSLLWLATQLLRLREQYAKAQQFLIELQRNKIVLDITQEGVLSMDRQGKITFVNAAALQLLKYTEDEMIGHNQHTLLHHSKADGNPYLLGECPIYHTSQDGRLRTVKGEVFWRKDDTYMPVEYVTKSIWDNDDIVETVILFHDVSGSQRLEDAASPTAVVRQPPASGEPLTPEDQHLHKVLLDVGARLQAIIHNTVVGIVFINLDGQCIHCNARWAEMLGCTMEQALEINFFERLHAEEAETGRQYLAMLITGTADVLRLTQRFVRKDQHVFWSDTSMVAIRSHSGTIESIVNIISDTSKFIWAEEQLKESKERLRTIINAIPDIICLKDEEGRWLEANTSYLKLFQLENIAYRGKKAEELAKITHEMYQSAFSICETSDEKTWQTATLNHVEETIPSINGEYRVFDIIKVPIFDADGHRKRLVLLGRDMTDRKHAEEQLREAEAKYHSLVEQVPAVIYIVNIRQKNILTYISPQVESLTGFPSHVWLEDPLLWRKSIHPDDHKRVLTEYVDYLRTLPVDIPLVSEHRVLTRTGKTVWINSHAMVIRDMEGRAQFLQGIVTDITERKHAEEALQQANHELNLRLSELDERNHEITLLSEIGNALQTCLSVTEAYTVIAHFMARLFPNTVGLLGMLKASSNLVETVATWGELAKDERISVFSPSDCWGLRRGRIHQVTNTKVELSCKHIVSELPITAYLCIPMMAQGEMLGLLHIAQLETESETNKLQQDARQRLAETVTEHIALALSNLRLRETLRNQSVRDPLTGLFNRRYLEETLEREIHRATRNQTSVGVIMIDLDHFKLFNDTFGHDAGDTVLQTISRFLRTHIRKEDIACRYGGEEFTLVLPGVSAEEAQKRAVLLKDGVKHLLVKYRGQTLGPVTLSMGIGIFPQHGKNGEEVLYAADTALYRAKTQGRDCVILAD